MATSVQENPEAVARIPELIVGDRNARGIPSAIFVESVDTFMTGAGIRTIEPLVGSLQQLYSKYKFMETSLQKSRDSFKRKVPETEKDLAAIKHLIEKQEEGESIKTRFNLADNVYAKATVDCSVGKVCIWLGANVMVEYSYDEALELLEANKATATERLAQIDSDLSFLRDQIITTEVNIARIFNHDVRRRRQETDKALAEELEANGSKVPAGRDRSPVDLKDVKKAFFASQADGVSSVVLVRFPFVLAVLVGGLFASIASRADQIRMEMEEQAAVAAESDWELRHDEASGASFYYNVRTGEATWDDPIALQATSDTGPLQQWTEAQDENGHVYYVNLQTMETSWEVPQTMVVGATKEAIAPVSPAVAAPLVRPSTAEQMDRLNRLLSGDDDDEDEDNGAASNEQIHGDADLGIINSDNGLDEDQPLTEQSEQSEAIAQAMHADQPEDMPWMMFINEGDGLPYYYNHLTGECVWEPPEAFVQYHEQQEAHEALVAPSGLMVEMEPIGSNSINDSDSADMKDQEVAPSAIEDVNNFEEKVRRAIDAVSKTPVGSSRLLLVRTPTERLSSRPGSRPASGDGSSRIRQASVDSISATASTKLDVMENPSPETESTSATAPSVEEIEPIESSYAVTSTDEGLPALATSEEMVATDFAIAVFVEEAAVVLQCLVRCFLARHRVQRKRRDRMREAQIKELDEAVNQSEPHSSPDAIDAEKVSVLQYEVQQAEDIAASDALASFEPETALIIEDMSVLPVAVENDPTEADAMENDQVQEINSGVSLEDDDAVTNDMTEELQPVSVGMDDAPDSLVATSMDLQSEESPQITDETNEANDSLENASTSDSEELNVINRMEPAALILQCAVRCFVARHRVARKRQEREQLNVMNDSKVDPQFENIEVIVPGVSLAPDISIQIENKDDPLAVSVTNQDKFAAAFSTSSMEEKTAGANNDSGSPIIDNNDPEFAIDPEITTTVDPEITTTVGLEITTAVDELLPPMPDKEVRPSTSTSSPPSRAKSRDSTRRLPSQAPLTYLGTSKKPSVLDFSQYFPPRPRRATEAKNTQKQETSTPHQMTAGIPRKKIDDDINLQSAGNTADDKVALREQRKQERDLLVAQKREKWIKEVEEYRAIYQKSANKLQEERQKIIEAAESERKQQLRLLESRLLARDLDTEANQSQSMWHSVKNGTPSVSSLEQFKADLDKALDSATFISTMKQTRYAELVDREHRLQTASERLDAQLELIDVYLVTDDPEITAPLKSFQAKYAKALRKKQQDTRRALRFWQARIDEYPHSVSDEDDRILPEEEAKYSWQHRINTHWKNLPSDNQRNHVIHDLRFASGDSLLHFVVWKGWDAHVAHLISLGWDVNAVDNSVSRWTPLHEACRAGHVDICTRLLSAGARLDVVDTMGDSPLHAACRLGWLRVVHTLLAAAEPTEIRTERSHTARSNTSEKVDALTTSASMQCSLSEFYYLRNRKHRRAIDLTKKQSLREYLEEYSKNLVDTSEHAHKTRRHTRRATHHPTR